MVKFKLMALLGAAALVSAGCGSLPTSLTADEALSFRASGSGEAGGFKGGMKGPKGHKGEQGPRGLFPGVELTAEQQAAMQALVEKYKPAGKGDREARQAEKQAKAEAVKAALTAETFDADALKAALTPSESAAKPPRDPQFLVEARAILTDAQREQAIAKLQEAPAGKPEGEKARPDMASKLTETLSLTEAQQAALAELTAAFEANKPERDPAAHRQAMISFLETGDVSALPTPGERPAPPVDAIVAFVGTLDAAQRAQLAEGPFLTGGHKGGHGGHKGPKGFQR